jgi:hypothetical protein
MKNLKLGRQFRRVVSKLSQTMFLTRIKIIIEDCLKIFSLDSLASCAFGVDGGSFKDPNAIFVRNAARIFQNTKWDLFMLSVRFTPVRYLLNWFKLDTNKPRETRFFRDLVRQVS